MNKRIIDAIPELITILNKVTTVNGGAFMGFDACIDIIVRIVREKKDNAVTDYYSTSGQFADFLKKQGNKSCGVELQTKLSKIGGNMVITANALGNLGIKAECAGTFGFPDILPVFRAMSPNCNIHTIAETISATALEFDNSKVIMFDPGPYVNLTWDNIKSVLGKEKIIGFLSDKRLVSFLNWSEIENSSQIWQGFLDEILPHVTNNVSNPFFFTDFSDCSRKQSHEIHFALDLLGRFREYYKVVFSLNHNEADLIADAMHIKKSVNDDEFIRDMYNVCKSDILIIHRTKDAVAFDGNKIEICDTFFCNNPAILTGGGDNFNAGFCYGMFLDLDLFTSLLMANAVSGSYVKTGISPDKTSLIYFLKENF